MKPSLAAAVLLAIAGGVSAEQPACGGFVGPTRLPVQGVPVAMATADFNLDGLPDVVTLSEDTLSVRLGDAATGLGSELFTAPATEFAAYVIAGDFDGGAPDVLTIDAFNALRFFHGNGDGTFAAPVDAGYGGFPTTVIDVNGDGRLDIAWTGVSGNGLVVRLGRGDGTFEDPIVTTVDTFASSLAFGDIDGDGILDAAIGGFYQNMLIVLPGHGDGTFGPQFVLDTTNTWSSLVLADFDGDGILDLVGIESNQTLEFLHGNGNFTFGAPTPSPAGIFPSALLPADMNGDGILDLVAPQTDGYSPGSGGLQVLVGQGDGTFLPGPAYATGAGGSVAAVGDFNGDGSLDVALAPSQFPEVWWLRGQGNGLLHATPLTLLGSPSSLLASGDFDEDGISDLVVAGFDSSTGFSGPTVALGRPSQQFEIIGVEPTNRFLVSAVLGDFHDTGHLDLAYFSLSNGTAAISLFEGHGDGTFGFEQLQALSIPVANQQYPLAAGRFGSDSHLDLALAVWDPVGLQESIEVLKGDGTGAFVPRTVATLPEPLGAMAAADLNGDGVVDLVAVGSGSPAGILRIFYGAPDGTFTESPPYAVGTFPSCLIVTDIDGNGAPDIVVGDEGSGAILIFRGDGHGNFATPYGVAAGFPVLSVAAADINGDGHTDIVAAGFADSKASLLLGYGDGTFAAPETWVCGTFPEVVVTGDFDGDGRLDAAVADEEPFQGSVAVLWNARLTSITVAPASALLGLPATLTAQGGGVAAITYQWERNGMPLSDGGGISGSQTSMLTIDPATFADVASYSVSVTDSCGTTLSNAVALDVEFADVPASSPFHADILSIARAGITSGCGGSNYCPTSPVRRDQMAAFLLKSEHGAAYLPPPCSGVFADVPCPSTFANWIEQLAAESVTSGCGGSNYCPDSSVTRAQMAVFLLKTKNGPSYVPPPAAGIFGDVPVGSFAADFIEALYNQGISGGCQTSPLLYCPDNPVLRQQMATLLVRTFNLP